MKPVRHIDAAIRVIGVGSAFTIMLGMATADTFSQNLVSDEVRSFLTRHAFSRWGTAQNLCRYLSLDEEQSCTVQLTALLESLGIYAGLLYSGPASEKIRELLEDAIAQNRPPCCCDAKVRGYRELSARIAEEWGTPPSVIEAIRNPLCEDGSILQAVDELIAAKIARRSQTEALLKVLNSQPRWVALRLTSEIDLVVFA
jgi:HD-like signal output (HDOD) protein